MVGISGRGGRGAIERLRGLRAARGRDVEQVQRAARVAVQPRGAREQQARELQAGPRVLLCDGCLEVADGGLASVL